MSKLLIEIFFYCFHTFIEFMDRIHIETSQKLNYADSVKFCQDRNSQLIEIDTSEQMESVAAELRRVIIVTMASGCASKIIL